MKSTSFFRFLFLFPYYYYYAWGMSTDAFLSRLQTTQCALQVSVGRIDGTAMPPEWAASGAKLGFALEVEFCEELCSDYNMNKERLLQGQNSGGQRSFRAVEPLNDPTFVSSKGTEQIEVTEGAYGCDRLDLQAQQYGLRFFVDFPKGAVRNDVEVPAERIYFISTAWIQDPASLERAQKRQQQLQQSLQQIGEELAELNQPGGFLAKAIMGLQKTAKLMEKRDKLFAQLEQLEQAFPLSSSERAPALIEGPNDLLFVKEGVIAVKRLRGTMGTREQYWWVGTFSIDEFFEDEDEEEEP